MGNVMLAGLIGFILGIGFGSYIICHLFGHIQNQLNAIEDDLDKITFTLEGKCKC